MSLPPQSLTDALSSAGQSHVLRYWEELSVDQQERLQGQIEEVDLQLLDRLSKESHAETDWESAGDRAEPPTAVRQSEMAQGDLLTSAKARGEEALRAGEVAVIIVAGGQGTRLGFEKPKGLFPIGPVSDRTLFEVLFDCVRARSIRYAADIPVLLMTSPATHAATLDYLQANDYLGLSAEEVQLFCQGTMPAIDAATGEILLAAKESLALSPDGHGGMLAALDRSGALGSLSRRGVKYIYYCQVDNPLAEVADPTLIGLHILRESELTTQVVPKSGPMERVGNVVNLDGKLQIIEYSDLPDKAAHQEDANGLKLWAGNIAIHVFDLAFLERVKDDPDALPFHIASKKVPFVNDEGDLVEPDEPNGKKFERFIFDLLPHAKNALAVEAEKCRVFAPVKNADGAASDTPELSKQAISTLGKEMLEAAGFQVPDGATVEVNPRFALDADELRSKLESSPEFSDGRLYLHDA